MRDPALGVPDHGQRAADATGHAMPVSPSGRVRWTSVRVEPPASAAADEVVDAAESAPLASAAGSRVLPLAMSHRAWWTAGQHGWSRGARRASPEPPGCRA